MQDHQTRSAELRKVVIICCLVSLLLAACQRKPIDTIEFLPTYTPSRTNTYTPSPTNTQTPTATITSTPEPTFTLTPTPTETIQWDQRGLSLTPIPIFNEIITADNVNRVDALAVWGNGKANTLAVSPDGSTLAVGTGIGVTLYDSTNFRTLTTLVTPYSVQSISLSSDDQFIALGQYQGTIDVYELERELLVARLTVPGVPFSDPYQVSVLFAPDGAYFTSIIETNATFFINRWKTDSWQQITAFTIPSGITSYLNPSADLLGIVYDNQLVLQSLSFAEESQATTLPASLPRTYWERYTQQNGDMTASSLGDFILVNDGNSILHWRLLEEDITYRLDQYPTDLPDPCYEVPNSCQNMLGTFSWTCADTTRKPPIEKVILSPDNFQVLVLRNDNRTELLRARTGRMLWEIEAHFSQAAFSPNSAFFFGLRLDGTIEKRDMDDGSLLMSLHLHPSQLTGLSFAPDGSYLAAGYTDGWIRFFSTFTGEMLGVLDGSATTIQFSSDGKLLAAGLEDGTVRIYELAEGRFFDLPGGHLSKVTGIAFSEDEETIITGSHDCTLSLWDFSRRSRRQNLTPGGSDPFQISQLEHFYLTESQFLLAKENGVFEVKGSESTAFFAPRNTIFSSLALAPDRRYLAVTGQRTLLFPLLAQNPVREALELTPSLDANGQALAFTPDSSLLIVAFTTGFEFRSVPDGEWLANIPFTPPVPSTNPPIDITVSPNGTMIAMAKRDGLIYIFNVLEETP